MGVPKFYRWLSERYPLINQIISSSTILPEFDNLYLDMNGIIHACTHPNDNGHSSQSLTLREMMLSIFRYIDRIVTEIVKPKKLLFLAIDGVAPRAKLNQQRARRFRAAQDRLETINKAKQRGDIVEGDGSNMFDSNSITPGTEFMEIVQKHIMYFIRKKIKEDPLWANLTIIFSGHDVPGEGEHKIMQYIRDFRSSEDYTPNTRHCMYGQDADLIMLALASHEPHFALLREVIDFGFNTKGAFKKSSRELVMKQSKDVSFQLLHISLLREYIALDFASDLDPVSSEDGSIISIDHERIIDDFIFLTFLVGNDFLPHLPTLDISEHAFDKLITAYRELLGEMGIGYIVENGEIGDFTRLEALFVKIGNQEEQILAQREVEEKKYRRRQKQRERSQREDEEEITDFDQGVYHDDDDLDQDELQEMELQEQYERAIKELTHNGVADNVIDSDDFVLITNNGEETNDDEQKRKKDFRGRYYFEKFRVLVNQDNLQGKRFMRQLSLDYLKGLIWCLAYYIKGCISWTWYFPYHYGPMLQDMTDLANLYIEIEFDLGRPFSPFQQLLGCLPPLSSNLLPMPYRYLMLSSESPIRHFYPETFELDSDGKKNPWEAVVLLDFIDEQELLSAEKKYCPPEKLTTSEKRRNQFGAILYYEYEPSNVETYLSCNYEINLPDIVTCHSTVRQREFNLSPGHFFQPRLLPGTSYPIAGFPSLTSLPINGIEREHMKINVFGMPSKYKSIILDLQTLALKNMDVESIPPEQLLDRIVFTNYPHAHEARVVGFSTEKKEIRLLSTITNQKNKTTNTIANKNLEFLTKLTTSSTVMNRQDSGNNIIKIEGNRQVTIFDEYSSNQWKTATSLEEEKYLKGRGTPGTGGMVIGTIPMRLILHPLVGMSRNLATGQANKVYSPQSEIEIPVQLVLWTPIVEDKRFIERSEMSIPELFPLGASVIAVTGALIGCKGTVIGPHESNTSSQDGVSKKARFYQQKNTRPARPQTKNPNNNPRTIDVEFQLPFPEPEFGYNIVNSLREQYLTTREVCQMLRISGNLLGKIAGSIIIEVSKQNRYDIGLNFKRNGVYQLLGYVRQVNRHQENKRNSNSTRNIWHTNNTIQIIGMETKNNSAHGNQQDANSPDGEVNYWEYSTAAVTLIGEYKKRFPLVFSRLEQLPYQAYYRPAELFESILLNSKPATSGISTASASADSNSTPVTYKSIIETIMNWMKEQEFFQLPRSPLTTDSMSREGMIAVERAADIITSINNGSNNTATGNGMTRVVVRNIPIEKVYCNVHRSEHDTALEYNLHAPELGDRVVNLAAAGVPLGLRGTVVAIHHATRFVDVIFDEEFIGGKSLQGSCSQFRGRLCAWSDLLLISTKTPLTNSNNGSGNINTSTSNKSQQHSSSKSNNKGNAPQKITTATNTLLRKFSQQSSTSNAKGSVSITNNRFSSNISTAAGPDDDEMSYDGLEDLLQTADFNEIIKKLGINQKLKDGRNNGSNISSKQVNDGRTLLMKAAGVSSVTPLAATSSTSAMATPSVNIAGSGFNFSIKPATQAPFISQHGGTATVSQTHHKVTQPQPSVVLNKAATERLLKHQLGISTNSHTTNNPSSHRPTTILIAPSLPESITNPSDQTNSNSASTVNTTNSATNILKNMMRINTTSSSNVAHSISHQHQSHPTTAPIHDILKNAKRIPSTNTSHNSKNTPSTASVHATHSNSTSSKSSSHSHKNSTSTKQTTMSIDDDAVFLAAAASLAQEHEHHNHGTILPHTSPARTSNLINSHSTDERDGNNTAATETTIANSSTAATQPSPKKHLSALLSNAKERMKHKLAAESSDSAANTSSITNTAPVVASGVDSAPSTATNGVSPVSISTLLLNAKRVEAPSSSTTVTASESNLTANQNVDATASTSASLKLKSLLQGGGNVASSSANSQPSVNNASSTESKVTKVKSTTTSFKPTSIIKNKKSV